MANFDGNPDHLQLLEDENFHGVFVLPEAKFIHFYNNKVIENHGNPGMIFRSLKEKIFGGFHTIFLRKQSCLKNNFEEQMLALSSNGLILHIIRKYLDRLYLNAEMDIAPRALTLHQIMGVFIVCGILYLIAFIVFIAEVIIHRIKRLN